MTSYEQRLISACTADHPDHQYLREVGGEPCLWTVWCSICKGKEYNENGHHNQPNQDMNPDYIAAVTEAARLVCQEQQRLSALRRSQREAQRHRGGSN